MAKAQMHTCAKCATLQVPLVCSFRMASPCSKRMVDVDGGTHIVGIGLRAIQFVMTFLLATETCDILHIPFWTCASHEGGADMQSVECHGGASPSLLITQHAGHHNWDVRVLILCYLFFKKPVQFADCVISM